MKSFAKEYLTVNNDMDSLTHYSIYFVSDKEDIDSSVLRLDYRILLSLLLLIHFMH